MRVKITNTRDGLKFVGKYDIGIVKICAVRNSPKSEIRGKCAGFTEWSVAERRKSSAARRLGGVRGDPLTVLHRRQAAGVY